MAENGGRVTRTEVARHAGVSTAVVSYVLNDGPRPVAAATRERVLESMRVLGYRPNATARALRTQRSMAVGLVVPDVSNVYYGALARALSNAAFDGGYAVLLGDSDNDPAREAAQIDSLVDRQVDGLVVISLQPDSDIDTRQTPTVFLDHRTREGQSVVLPDNYDGACQATGHLLDHGRRRVGHVGGPEGAPGADDRHRGWLDAVTAAGRSESAAYVERAEFSRQGGYEAGTRLLARAGDRPDAVFVSSDVQALGLLRAARELDVRVPDDLAVVSFDGTEEAVFSDPPLTAVEQPVEAIATAALAAILRPAAEPTHVLVPVRLVTRTSCGCSSAGGPPA